SLRRDGSYRFSPANRWGYFPAISGGWRISEEPFFANNVKFMDLLKLRASFGVTGNDAVGGYQWYDKATNAGSYVLGETPAANPGIRYGGSYQDSKYVWHSYDIANKNLTWEKSRSYNFGIDARFFKSLNFTAEYWMRHTYDILGQRQKALPGTFGAQLPDENYGQVDSRGIELELGYDGQIGKQFSFYVRGNVAYATNKIIKQDVAENTREVDNPVGRPLDYVKGLVVTDMIRTQADLDKIPGTYTIYGVKPQLGMYNYQDVSGPGGKPDGIIDDFDNQVISNYSWSPYTAGLNLGGSWKGFSVDVFFQGVAGGKKLYNDVTAGRGFNVDHAPSIWLDRWTPETPNGRFPHPVDGWFPDQLNSTFWLYNTSYARLKNATVSYTIPRKLNQKLNVQKIQVYLSGTNLFRISDNSFDFDVELNGPTSYPVMKTFTAGLNITL
nr:TonB-dependent receptor [Chitinophagaceae bacterium]